MASRIFAILAAVFLVVAVGIAALMPLDQNLAQAIMMLDKTVVEWARTNSPTWLWTSVEQPFLVRPIWLLPACLGVIAAGIATSVNLGKASPSRRRRS